MGCPGLAGFILVSVFFLRQFLILWVLPWDRVALVDRDGSVSSYLVSVAVQGFDSNCSQVLPIHVSFTVC